MRCGEDERVARTVREAEVVGDGVHRVDELARFRGLFEDQFSCSQSKLLNHIAIRLEKFEILRIGWTEAHCASVSQDSIQFFGVVVTGFVSKVRAVLAEMFLMAFEDRRAEPRVKSRGCFQLFVGGTTPLTTTVYDTSPSGICVEAVVPVEINTAVRLDGEGFVADGVVRFCKRDGGTYRIGICFVPMNSDNASSQALE
jgi:PilZ domain